MSTKVEATIDDLYKVDGKAELVNGEIVHMSPTGQLPHYAALEISMSLREYAKRTRRGYAFGDNAAFVVNLPNRKSFSPDAGFYAGKLSGMKFFEGAPVFAVEVRIEGPTASTHHSVLPGLPASNRAVVDVTLWLWRHLLASKSRRFVSREVS
jgi:Uma2 family endonuclease